MFGLLLISFLYSIFGYDKTVFGTIWCCHFFIILFTIINRDNGKKKINNELNQLESNPYINITIK